MKNEEKIKQVAIMAAQEAGEVLKGYFEKTSRVSKKGGVGNIVTQADQESERVIIAAIKRYFPDHGLLSEEGVRQQNKSSYLWSIDPLDGTLPFVQGLPWWSISIGVLRDSQPIVGVVYVPFGLFGNEEVYSAIRGKGVFLNGQRIAVNNKGKLEEAMIGFDYGYTKREKRIKEVLLRTVSKLRYTLTLACASVPLCFLARGLYDGYIHQNLEHWDIAATSLIIDEAGGRVTDFKGHPIVWEIGKEFDYLATNGILHEKLIHLLTVH